MAANDRDRNAARGDSPLRGDSFAAQGDWRTLIECCRPESNDAFLPEHAELAPLAEKLARDELVQEQYERIQQADAAIRDSICQAPVPDGLLERLLASVEASQTPEESTEQVASPPSEERAPWETRATPAPRRERREQSPARASKLDWRTTRRWALAASLVGLLCALGYAASNLPWKAVGGAEVTAESARWLEELRRDPSGWNSDLQKAPLDRLPIDSQVVSSPSRWRQVKTSLGDVAAAYDVRRPGQDRTAVLFVVRTDRPLELPSAPPVAQPQQRTQGWVTGAWARPHDKLLYVLVVEGSIQRYRQFVRPQKLASAPPQGSRPSFLRPQAA